MNVNIISKKAFSLIFNISSIAKIYFTLDILLISLKIRGSWNFLITLTYLDGPWIYLIIFKYGVPGIVLNPTRRRTNPNLLNNPVKFLKKRNWVFDFLIPISMHLNEYLSLWKRFNSFGLKIYNIVNMIYMNTLQYKQQQCAFLPFLTFISVRI